MADHQTTPGWLTVGTTDNLEIAIRASSLVAIRPAPDGGTLIETAAGKYVLAAAADPAKLLLDVCRMEKSPVADHQTTDRWADKPLPEDAEIAAAHPLNTGRHDLYMEAMRLVGARHSKDGLVELVNWLLAKAETAEQKGYDRGHEAGTYAGMGENG